MVAVRHPAQRRQRLALRAGRDDHELVVREVLDLLRADEHPLGDVDVAEHAADVRVLAHRAADQRDAPVERTSGVDHLLHAVDVRREAGDHDPALAASEHLLETRADGRLRQRHARPVGVRGVTAQEQQALAPQLGQPRDVRRHAVHRRLVELVVARHQHRAELGGERDGERVRDRVGHLHHLDGERPGVEGLAGQHVLDLNVLQAVLVELRAHHRRRERPAVDHRGAVQLAQHEGQRAHVVLVAVGEHDRLDVVLPLAQVGEVGQHEVDPELVGGREHQPGVHDDDAAVVLDDHHVLADLTEPAQRQDPERARDSHRGEQLVALERLADDRPLLL